MPHEPTRDSAQALRLRTTRVCSPHEACAVWLQAVDLTGLENASGTLGLHRPSDDTISGRQLVTAQTVPPVDAEVSPRVEALPTVRVGRGDEASRVSPRASALRLPEGAASASACARICAYRRVGVRT